MDRRRGLLCPRGSGFYLLIEALRLPAGSVEGLMALGVSHIGPLAAMPRGPLTLRFGPDIARKLDQAFGCVSGHHPDPVH